MNTSHQFITQTAQAFSPLPISYELLHMHGKEFPGLAAQQPRHAIPKQCFQNAFELSELTGLYYCEGYATPSTGIPFPIPHAWCVDADGLVYDSTWKDGGNYFGLRFSSDGIQSLMAKSGVYGVLESLYRLSRGRTPEQVKALVTSCLI